jgi:hypothetical protein
LVATIGVAFGLAVHAIFAALGAAVLIQQFPLIYEALRWIGVAYLLFLAWEGWQTQAETSPGRADLRRTAGPLLLRGFLSNVFPHHPLPLGLRDSDVRMPCVRSHPSDCGRANRSDEVTQHERMASRTTASADVRMPTYRLVAALSGNQFSLANERIPHPGVS